MTAKKALTTVGRVGFLAAALAFGALPAQASLIFQGVTFETIAVDADTLTLHITNAVSGGTGNWTSITYLNAFEIKDIGNITGATLVGWTTDVSNGLSANLGCTTGGTTGACFTHTPPFLLTDNFSFTIDFVGTSIDLTSPHVKVQFLCSLTDKNACGNLLSQNVPSHPPVRPDSPIPEPATLVLIGLGLLGLGVVRKRVVR